MSNEYFHGSWHELSSTREHYSISYNISDLCYKLMFRYSFIKWGLRSPPGGEKINVLSGPEYIKVLYKEFQRLFRGGEIHSLH